MRSLFVVCASLFVLSMAASVWLWRELRAERELAASLPAQDPGSIQATPAPVAFEAMPAVAPAPASAAPGPAEAAPPVPAANAALAAQTAARQREIILLQSELWKDPEFRKAQLAQARASILRRRPALAQELDLSPDELDRLIGVLAEQQVGRQSQVSTAAVESYAARVQEMLRGEQEAMGQPDAAMVAALGPAKAAQWQEYQRTEPARDRVNALNAMLAQAGQQLDDTQLKSLIVALAPEGQRQRLESVKLATPLNPQDPDEGVQAGSAALRLQQEFNRRLLEAAEPLLDPAQLAAVRAQLDEENEIARAEVRVRERAAALQSRGQ